MISLLRILLEGRYDRMIGLMTDVIWVLIKSSRNKKQFVSKPMNITSTGIDVDLQVVINRKKNEELLIEGESYGDERIVITINLDPNYEPKIYSKMNSILQETLRHELEHILQYRGLPEKSKYPSQDDLEKMNKNPFKYFMSNFETEAMISGFYKQAKVEREYLDSIMLNYLNSFVKDNRITKQQEQQIIKKWISYAKKKFPNAKYEHGIS